MKRIAPFQIACAVALLGAGAGCHGGARPAFTELVEARRLADDLRVELAKTSNASDRAVLADTDEESIVFARAADKSAGVIEADAAALSARLARLAYASDSATLQEFEGRFAEYRKVDRDVLDLAVQNTNLKAQRLSFGPVRDAADAFVAALKSAAEAAPGKERCRVDGLVARAALAAREIQIVQAPHIAEADDAAMTKMEKQMGDERSAIRDALEGLAHGAGTAMTPKLDAAKAALDRFDKLSAELVALSRRNSNVRSLALALRRTPSLVAACDGSLAQLQESLAKEGFTGTR